MKKIYRNTVTLTLMAIFLAIGLGAGIFFYFADQLPPLSELQNYDMKTGSEVYDKDDNLIYVFAVENRRRTDIRELPDYLINGLIAVEDRNFYKHWGVDIRALMRALLIDIVRRDFAQGASTITQQLARNMFLSFEKQVTRKIKESMLAVSIEKNYAKEEILEMYFDKVYLGSGVYGVEAASHRYFSKEAKDLTVAEAAMIIGLVQLPGLYSPISNPQRALSRRNTVLKVMYEQNVISYEQYMNSVYTPIITVSPKSDQGAADYFIEHVRLLVERKYGTTRLFADGLKIYTTLDYDLQVYADSLLNYELSLVEEKQNYEFKYEDFPPDQSDIPTPYLQGGVFAIDPQTGYVNVMIGGRNFNHSKFNRITQARRQPGSSFKPIVYTAALNQSYSPATVIKDEPVFFVQNDTLFWAPRNYSPGYEGYIRLREGLNKSINTIAVKIIADIGPSSVLEYARRFGLSTPLRPFYSLGVGSLEVLPHEMISAYTVFANNGERVTPIYIRRIEDKNGNTLEAAAIDRIRVIDEKTSFIMSSMMETVVDAGTARSIRWRGYRWFAAGKTGTTDDYRDAWFIGYNKKLVLGIWTGFDDNTSLGRGQSGANTALPAWPGIMQKAVEMNSPLNRLGKPVVDAASLEIQPPEGILKMRVSAQTGFLPKSFTEETVEEFFIIGTEPTPLSDSLSYNFYPTQFRENPYDILFFNLGGRRRAVPDTTITFKLDGSNVLIPKK